MAGLATGRKAPEVPISATAELVDDFPGSYRPNGRMIVALFLSREIRALGINYSERVTLHQAIHQLIDPLSSSILSEEGMRAMNYYAWGGFEVLQEWFEDRPRAIEVFLPVFKERLDEVLQTP